MISTWNALGPDANSHEELMVSFDENRKVRVLVLPALFDEANLMRRFTLQMMRALDGRGIDSFLPDLPGCNESVAPLDSQTLAFWRQAAKRAADQLEATHVLAIRGGALIAPEFLAGWHYASLTGAKLLRSMVRARMIASREAGRDENSGTLLEAGRREGLVLNGWPIGAAMLRELESAEPKITDLQTNIVQSELGGAGLWLRAEPSEDEAQSQALAAILDTEQVEPG